MSSAVQLADSGTFPGSNSASPISSATPVVRLASRPDNKLTESLSDEESSPFISCAMFVFGLLQGLTVRLRHTQNELLNSGKVNMRNTE